MNANRDWRKVRSEVKDFVENEVYPVENVLNERNEESSKKLKELMDKAKEKNLLISKLNRLGMLEQDSGLEDVLRMTPENILDRRLQTQVYLQGLASTPKQSRQLITHRHISVDGSVNRVPGMLVTKLQEKNISYSPASALNSDLHPVRPGIQETYDDSPETEDSEESIEKKTEDKPVAKETKKETSKAEKPKDSGEEK